MKTKSNELEIILPELEKIFSDYRRFNHRIKKQLETIGYSIEENGNHIKLIFSVKDKIKTCVISKSPSDVNAGRQILRSLRKLYEE